MQKRTKIVATVGPACESEGMISRLIDAGVDVFRLNVKHNTPEWHKSVIARIRKIAAGSHIGILMDLQGPEICIGSFRNGSINLNNGDKVLLTSAVSQGDGKTIAIADNHVLNSLKKGDRFFMDDGNLEFRVLSSGKNRIHASVVKGGILFDHKSVNIPDLVLKKPILTKTDFDFISLGVALDVDFFALSFVREAKDVDALRSILKKKKSDAMIISKIERQSAVDNFDSILEASDGIMIGRGDLGIEIPLPMVPIVQKEIIKKCRVVGKPVITATQMLESMITNHRPTRAEVSDVANAIIDGTDAVMLSAESATGEYPEESVRIMVQIDKDVQRHASVRPSMLLHSTPDNVTEAISQAVDALSCNNMDFAAILLLTETGRTARAVSKFRPAQRVFAATKSSKVAAQIRLTWGVEPLILDFSGMETGSIFRKFISLLKKAKHLSAGEKVVCVSGQIVGKENMTNSIMIIDS